MSPRENPMLVGVFCIALVVHFYCATLNWKSPFMPGHEFRQAQTAIVSYYIDEQDNFSPLYETPVLGKPWVSILLEVPLYEWSVVGLSRWANWPHYQAARTISLACFYLALPAFYLLLGRLGLSRPRRLFALALVLTCPVYIFYSRAFLMESMEIMCCGWFLLGFVRTMDERRWYWLVLTAVAGTGAALIKSITWAVWLPPAAGYGVWLLWRDFRSDQGWRVPLRTLLWGLASVVVPFAALRWWINLTDPIKAAHASAYIFTSKNLSEGNWGILNFTARFSWATWSILLARWREAIMSPWLVGLGLGAGLAVFDRFRRPILGLSAVFFLAQWLFPFAYAYQDYYYYACTVFVLAALAFVLLGVLESRLSRWLCCLVLAVPFAAQLTTYWQGYRTAQIVQSNGGFPFTEALRDLAPKGSVLIIAGADWAAMIPLYAQRKALMIRNGMEYNQPYLARAFADLADEDVSALVLVGDLRANKVFLNQTAAKFDLETTPTFSHAIADVYFSRLYVDRVIETLKGSRKYNGINFTPRDTGLTVPSKPFNVSAGLARDSFEMISPAPLRAYFRFGLSHEGVDGDSVLSAHPDSDLWLHAPAGAKQIKWDFGIIESAYERLGEKTDGVEFTVAGELAANETRTIFSRLLDPVNQPADRGRQHVTIPYKPRPGEILRFTSRPFKSPNFDWAYWARIEVR